MQQLFETPIVYHLTVAAALVAVSFFLSRAVRVLLEFVGRKLIQKTETELDDRILEVISRHVRPLMIVFGVYLALREIRKGAAPAETAIHQLLDYCDVLLYIVVVLLIAKIILDITREVINWYLETVSVEGGYSLKMTLGPLTNKAVNVLVGMVAVIIVLDHFGINIGSLLVSLGVGSLAVALAAQETLSNMIAGFVILIDRPFRVGDRIEVAPGQVGDVKEIGLRSTRVLNFDNNLIVIPNADLVRGRIINYSHPHLEMRVLLRFEVAYGSDPARVRTILLRIAAANPALLKEPPPQVFMTALNDSSVQFTFVGRVGQYSDVFSAETAMREEAYREFAAEGIEIPFPQRVVHMKGNA